MKKKAQIEEICDLETLKKKSINNLPPPQIVELKREERKKV